MKNGFDFQEVDQFTNKMLEMAQRNLPKETKTFLRKEGNKLKRVTLKTAKTRVRTDHKKPKKYKDAAHYHKSIKRGKVYKYNGALAIRTYSYLPHAHLIEDGHRLIVKGKEMGFVKGKQVFRDSEKEFQKQYYSDCENFIEEVIDQL